MELTEHVANLETWPVLATVGHCFERICLESDLGEVLGTRSRPEQLEPY